MYYFYKSRSGVLPVTSITMILIIATLIAAIIVTPGESSNLNSIHYYSDDLVAPTFLKNHLTFQYESKSGKQVYVFDGVVPSSLIMSARAFFSVNDDWRYVLFDKYVSDSSASFDHGNGIPWKSWQNPTVMSGTRIGHIFNAMVDFASGQSDVNTTNDKKSAFHLTEIYSAILRRGDVTELHQEGNTTSNAGYTAVMYTNLIWRKNSYGEMLFYEDDNDFDIFAVISPRSGRVVLFDNGIRYLTRPPSITELQGQYMIFAQFNSDPQIVYEKRTYFDSFLYEMKESRKKHFVCTDNVNEDNTLVDVEKHLFLKKQNKEGHVVAVFDGLFNNTDLDALRTFTVKYGKYYYDDHLDLTSDNVQWIAGFDIKKLVSSRFWPVVHQVASYVSGTNTWYPYDVACNLIRSADHTRFHLDTSRDNEQELTFLLYLNPNWTAANYGETAFMEKNFDSSDNDYVAEVVPKYGRAVIFDGNFPHSAHPPAPDYTGPRYTFVVKLSINKLEAIEKSFEEESQHSPIFAAEMMKEIRSDPDLVSRKQKISVVANYLQTKQIKQTIDRNPKTEDNFLQAMPSNDNDNDEINILSLLDLEKEIPLSNENEDLLMKMVEYYKIADDVISKMSEEEQDDDEEESDTSMLYTMEDRITSWRKSCGQDGDCLEDYFQLFLEQRAELSRRVSRDLLAMI